MLPQLLQRDTNLFLGPASGHPTTLGFPYLLAGETLDALELERARPELRRSLQHRPLSPFLQSVLTGDPLLP